MFAYSGAKLYLAGGGGWFRDPLCKATVGVYLAPQTVHLFGLPGVGKTHLATALRILAVNNLADLIASLTKDERENNLPTRLR